VAGVTFNVVTRFQGQDYERGARSARGETDALAKSSAALQRQLLALWAAYGGAQVLRQSLRDAEAWSRGLTQIINLTDVNRRQLAAWEPELRRIAVTAGRLPEEILGGLKAVTSAGIVGAEAMQVTEQSAKAAAIGLGEVNSIARLVSAAVQAYGPDVLSAAQATDVLLATVREGAAEAETIAPALGRVVGIAQQLGVSFAEVGGFIATFTRLGVDADEAVTALRGTLTTLLGPTKQQQDALALVGLTMADLRKEITEKGLAQALVDLVTRFRGNEDALAAVIPNVRALSGVLGAAGAQGEHFVEIQQAIEQSTGDVDRAFQEWLKSPAGQLEQMRAELANIRLELGNELLPVLIQVAHQVQAMFDNDSIEGANRFAVAVGAVVRAVSAYADVLDHISLLHWVNKWREGSAAATEMNLKLLALEQGAQRFEMTLQQGGGRVTSSIISKAREDAKGLAIELNAAQARLDALRSRYGVDPKTGKSEQALAPWIQGKLDRAAQEVRDLTAVYEPLKKAIRGVGEVYDDVDLSVPKGVVPSIVAVTDAQKKLLAAYQDAAREAGLQIKQEREIQALMRSTPYKEMEVALKRLAIEHEAQAVALQAESKYAELGAETARRMGTALAEQSRAAGESKLQTELLGKTYQLAFEVGERALDFFVEKLKEIRPIMGQAFGAPTLEEFTKRLQTLRGLEFEADLAVRVEGIDESSDRLRNLEVQYLEFLRTLGGGSIRMGEQIFAEMAKNFGWTVEQIKAELGEIQDAQDAMRIKGSARTGRDRMEEEVENARRLLEKGAISAEDHAAHVGEITRQFWDEQLSAWSGALDFLAGRFGGFFSYLQQLVNGIQQARGFGQSVGNIASGMGASASTAGALGALGTVVGIAAVVYDLVDKHIKAQKAKRFGEAGEFGIGGGLEGVTHSAGGKKLADAIRDLSRQVEDALGFSIHELERIGLQLRNDGKKVKAYVAGELIGIFGSVEEALQEAMRIALQSANTAISGMSDLMKQGLATWTAPDLGEMLDFLGALREISNLSLSDGAVALRETVRHLDELRITLSKFNQVTPAVTQGFADVLGSELAAWRAWSDSITGREKTAAEILAEKQRDAELFNAQKMLRIEELKLWKLQLTAEGQRLQGIGQIVGGGLHLRQLELTGEGEFLRGRGQLLGAELTQSEEYLAGLGAIIAAIDATIAALLEIPDIDISKIRLPRGGGRGGATPEDRDRLREEADRFGMGDVALALADAEQQFKDFSERVKDAGFKGAAAAALIQKAEEDLARKRKQITDAQKAASAAFIFRGTPYGGPVLSGIADINAEMNDLLEKNRELVEAGELSVREMRELNNAIREAGERQRQQLAEAAEFALLGELYALLGKDEEAARLSYELKLAELRIAYEELKIANEAYNLNLQWLDEIATLIDDFERRGPQLPGTETGGPTPQGQAFNDYYENQAKQAEEWAKRFADAMDLLESYEAQDAGSRLAETIDKIDDDFERIRETLGDTARVQAANAQAVQRAIQEFLEPVAEARRQLFLGPQGSLGAEDKFALLVQEALQAESAFKLGDLSVVERVPELMQDLLDQAAQVSPFGSQGYRQWETFARGFFDEILAMGGPDLSSPFSPAAAPLQVAGFGDLTQELTQGNAEQYDVLSAIRDSSDRTATAVQSIDYRLSVGVRVLGGAS
jgi:TP901 family phage tail tape measure protein